MYHDGVLYVTYRHDICFICFQIDVSYYPYDHQKCGIEITSWGFTTSQVMLDHMFDGINLEDYRSHIILIFHARSYV